MYSRPNKQIGCVLFPQQAETVDIETCDQSIPKPNPTKGKFIPDLMKFCI